MYFPCLTQSNLFSEMIYQMLLSLGATSKCDILLSWLKSSRLFRSSIIVQSATALKIGPVSLSTEAFSELLKSDFPKGYFLRNEDGSLPMMCTFDGRKKLQWTVNSAFERTFAVSSAKPDHSFKDIHLVLRG